MNGCRSLKFVMPVVIPMLASGLPCCRRVSGLSPASSNHPAQGSPRSETGQAKRAEVAVVLYEDGLKNGWQDWGWGTHEAPPNAPLRVRFENWGGLIFAKMDNVGDFGGVQFRIKLPVEKISSFGVRLQSKDTELPKVELTSDYGKDIGNGWTEVFVPFEQLNPQGLTDVDRVIIYSRRKMGPEFVEINHVALTKPLPRERKTYDPAKLTPVTFSVDCAAKATKVSPYLYGFAYYPFDSDATQSAQWEIGGTVRRWGGNPTSVYNWELGAWNTGQDWFFENHAASHQAFLDENEQHGIVAALTVPILGWVAKDTTSGSFPVSAFGPQEATDPYRPEFGNGKNKAGKPITPGPQTRAYVAITPDFVKRWIQTIKQQDAKSGKRRVWMYILDNEPMIWNSTHRDAHPEPLGYDELVKRTIEYGTAIREADPDAIIAGPAEWGWTNYLYSAKDMANGGPSVRPDRRAHDDLPVVAYYLRALAEHEKRTGTRILDVLDLHAYPYPNGVYGAQADPATAALRIRSTRMLWDPSYVDESWVKEPVNLLPRMRQWIDTYYPGRGMSIGEWNFGGERHMSGALAAAEVLGRFAQFGLTSAFYWSFPPQSSPASWAFRAYRNYDGKGGRFLDWYTPSRAIKKTDLASAFVSRDETGQRVVSVLLNFSPSEALNATLDLKSCGDPESAQAYLYEARSPKLEALPARANGLDSKLSQTLPPYSIVVLDVHLKGGTKVVR